MQSFRMLLEKKEQIDIESKNLLNEIVSYLHIPQVKKVKIFSIYDLLFPEDIPFDLAKTITLSSLSEIEVDNTFFDFSNLIDTKYICDNLMKENDISELNKINESSKIHLIPIALLDGQFDQKADSAISCLMLASNNDKIQVKTAKLYCIIGELTAEKLSKIKDYLLNPVDSCTINIDAPREFLKAKNKVKSPGSYKINILEDFSSYDTEKLEALSNKYRLAMSIDDLHFLQRFCIDNSKQINEYELKILDTYWSDHCRHTTFNTLIEDIEFESSTDIRSKALERFKKIRAKFIDESEPVSLMQIGTIYAKYCRENGLMPDVEQSEEVNACNIIVKDRDSRDWLVAFKNETHNHPTEIEPFGGASTCLGGAIRDPLSSRTYVFAAMRVTGSGDPGQPVEKTLKGKLPQRKITTSAAKGFSSYGNQIGLATANVVEFYHDNFKAKRLEAGAVIGAAPKENVVRKKPLNGDLVVLVGGRTGRDGIGGATGSSKVHDKDSINLAGAEVQKGNAVVERKLQRFFANREVARKIKRCNDFGAGGVAIAVGELADGLDIYLDKIPLKYDGLSPVEIILSESQERMACVVAKDDVDDFIKYANLEDLQATIVARVTDKKELCFYYRKKKVAGIPENLLNSSGAPRKSKALPGKFGLESLQNFFKNIKQMSYSNLLSSLNVASLQKLSEWFDSTIGGYSLYLPYGGLYQNSPCEGIASVLPDIDIISDNKYLSSTEQIKQHNQHSQYNQHRSQTAVFMASGYNPDFMSANPFIGAYWSVVESITRIVVMGGDFHRIRLSLQEYFGKPSKDQVKWGIVLSAMLGAFMAQEDFMAVAIGGKDSMSGSFDDIDVPPTLISFAVSTSNEDSALPNYFIKSGDHVYLLFTPLSEDFLPDKTRCLLNFEFFDYLHRRNLILSARTVRYFGIREAIFKSCIGNMIGFRFDDIFNMTDKFSFADGFNRTDKFSFNDCFNSADHFKLNKNFRNNYDYKIDIKTPMIGSIIFETDLTESEMEDYLEKFILQLKESKEAIDFIGHQAIEQDPVVFINHLGKTISERIISTKDSQNDLEKLLYSYEKPLLSVFHNETSLFTETQILKWKSKIKEHVDNILNSEDERINYDLYEEDKNIYNHLDKDDKFIDSKFSKSKIDTSISIKDIDQKIIISHIKLPKALIVVFPGTNCEFDTARAFQKNGIRTENIVVKTLTRSALKESIDDFAKSIEDCQILSIPGGFSMGDEPDGSGKFIAAFLRTKRVADSIERLLDKKGLILGICNGFQALIKSGLLTKNVTFPDGTSKPTLTQNLAGRHVSRIVKVRVLPNRSPWHLLSKSDQVYTIPVSHGEGRFYAEDEVCNQLLKNGQLSSVYIDSSGEIAFNYPDNPNGSCFAVESMISEDGLILGKMGHTERVIEGRLKNYPYFKAEPIFESASYYFK